MINFSNKLSLQETAEAIADFGHKVPMFVCGEPGIGKSAMGREVARLRGHEVAIQQQRGINAPQTLKGRAVRAKV